MGFVQDPFDLIRSSPDFEQNIITGNVNLIATEIAHCVPSAFVQTKILSNLFSKMEGCFAAGKIPSTLI
jgi:hypothetical protein